MRIIEWELQAQLKRAVAAALPPQPPPYEQVVRRHRWRMWRIRAGAGLGLVVLLATGVAIPRLTATELGDGPAGGTGGAAASASRPGASARDVCPIPPEVRAQLDSDRTDAFGVVRIYGEYMDSCPDGVKFDPYYKTPDQALAKVPAGCQLLPSLRSLPPGERIGVDWYWSVADDCTKAAFTVSPRSGPPGTTIRVKGRCSDGRRKFEVAIEADWLPGTYHPRTGERGGRFDVELDIPSQAPPGTVWVVVSNCSKGHQLFTVTSP